MSRELWLMRHGKAEPGGVTEDFDRHLHLDGYEEATRMAQWLNQQGFIPELILASPAQRAYATATIIMATLAMPSERMLLDERLYFQGVPALLAVLAEIPPEIPRVLLVGHNPDFSSLIGHLAGSQILPPIDLPTAGLARLALPKDWQLLPEGCSHLQGVTSPLLMPH